MMKGHILLLLVVVVMLAVRRGGTVNVPAGACPCPRNDLEQCAEALIDTNSDSIISAAEIDAFIGAQSTAGGCLPDHEEFRQAYNSTRILGYCDATGNGDLRHDDFVHANACLNESMFQHYVCRLCYMCGWTGAEVE